MKGGFKKRKDKRIRETGGEGSNLPLTVVLIQHEELAYGIGDVRTPQMRLRTPAAHLPIFFSSVNQLPRFQSDSTALEGLEHGVSTINLLRLLHLAPETLRTKVLTRSTVGLEPSTK